MVGSELYDALPSKLKVSDHIFASSESGLTKLGLAEMIQKRRIFKKDIMQSIRNILLEKSDNMESLIYSNL